MQTTLRMHAVHFSTFIYVEQGSFNADKLPIEGCSKTTAILLAFIPNRRLEDIESMGIGNVIRRHRSPIGDLSNINTVIETIHSILQTEHKKNPMKMPGVYGAYRELWWAYGFCHDPPYCVAYTADYKKTDDPSKMTPREPLNQAFAMPARNMVVRRLLSMPNWEPAERKLTAGAAFLFQGHAF